MNNMNRKHKYFTYEGYKYICYKANYNYTRNIMYKNKLRKHPLRSNKVNAWMQRPEILIQMSEKILKAKDRNNIEPLLIDGVYYKVKIIGS